MAEMSQSSTAAYDVDAAPAAVLIAGSEERGGVAARMMDAAGIRTRATMDFSQAGVQLADHGGLDLIVIEAERAPEELLDPVLARADAMARERPLSVVASVTMKQLDIAAAHLLGRRTQLLCAPDEAERAAALALACAQIRTRAGGGRAIPVMDDARREGEVARLRRLNEEVARIADTLARLTRGEDSPAFPREGESRHGAVRAPGSDYRGPASAEPVDASAQEIRAVIRSRRLREQFFADGLFADPAWDMLLDLYAAELERRPVSVSSLCIAASVPPTTALRWIGTMHDAGLFERHADPSDRRRAYIALSAKGLDGVRGYVAAVKRLGLTLV
jgi:DNA-binding MarR family transcriptional regulator